MNNYEFLYRDWLFGGDTDYPVNEITGLDPVNSRENTIERSLEHGSFPYAEYLEDRRVRISGDVNDDNPVGFQEKLSVLKAALVPASATLPLTFQFPGLPQQRVYCVPTRRSYPMDRDFSMGYTTWHVEFLAGDPRIYSEEEFESAAIARNSSVVVNNAGDFGSPPVITVFGPSTNPVLKNVSTDETLKVNSTLALNENLRIDFANKTVRIGTVSRYYELDPASVWWDLEPGDTEVRYEADLGTGTAKVVWRSAWY